MYVVSIQSPDMEPQEFEAERIELKYGNADFSEFQTFESADHIVPEVVDKHEGEQTLFEAEGLNEDGTEKVTDE